MTTTTSTALPFDFHVFYGLKTVEDLHAHLTGTMRFPVNAPDDELIREMAGRNIPLPPGYGFVEVTPTSPPLADLPLEEVRSKYVELLELVSQLHLQAKRVRAEDDEAMGRNWILTETGKALAKQPGLTEEQQQAFENPDPLLPPQAILYQH